jgi:hypothetical protein
MFNNKYLLISAGAGNAPGALAENMENNCV